MFERSKQTLFLDPQRVGMTDGRTDTQILRVVIDVHDQGSGEIKGIAIQFSKGRNSNFQNNSQLKFDIDHMCFTQLFYIKLFVVVAFVYTNVFIN